MDALKGEGPFTVFAPTDEAFAKLPQGTLDELLAEPEGLLTQILLYHVVPGKVMAMDVSDGLQAETLQGATAGIGQAVNASARQKAATAISGTLCKAAQERPRRHG